jgi:hypothetical protein
VHVGACLAARAVNSALFLLHWCFELQNAINAVNTI